VPRRRHWRGLSVVDGGLRFRTHAIVLPWRWIVDLTPDGALLRRRRSVVRLSWDDHFAARERASWGWWVLPTVAQGPEPGILVVEREESRVGGMIDFDRKYHIDERLLFPEFGGAHVLEWLAIYLAQTPTARSGLADPCRVAMLLDCLAAGRISRAHRPAEPLMGPRLDVYNAVERAIARRITWYGGRRFDTDPLPGEEEVLREARAHVPAHVPAALKTDELILAEIRRQLHAHDPWPFGVLVVDPT
jgi:hypothetical protein